MKGLIALDGIIGQYAISGIDELFPWQLLVSLGLEIMLERCAEMFHQAGFFHQRQTICYL